MQNKQLWALIVGMGLVSGGALAQQPPRQESPEVTAAEMEAMKEAAAAGGTGSVDGFGETYGEQVERGCNRSSRRSGQSRKQHHSGTDASGQHG